MTSEGSPQREKLARSVKAAERWQRWLKMATMLAGVFASLLGSLFKETGAADSRILLIATVTVGAVVASLAELILASRRHDPRRTLQARVKEAYLNALDSSTLSRTHSTEGANRA